MAKIFRRAALFLVFCIPAVAHSQAARVIDSLYAVLESHPARDTERVHTLLRIADRITSGNPDKAIRLLTESGSIADEIQYKKGKAYSLLYSSNAFIAKGQYQTGLLYSKQSMAVFESLNNKYGMGDCYHNYARCYFYLGDYDKAISNYKTAISSGEQTNDWGRQSGSLNALGVVYTKQGELDKAMECHKKALEIDQKQKNNPFGIASDLANIGTLLKNKGDYAAALEYYLQARDLKRQVGDQRGVGSLTGNIGMLYSELGKNAEAMEYHTKAAEIWEKIGNRSGLATTYNNIGVVYMNSQQYGQARKYFTDGLNINNALKDRYGSALGHTNLGTLDIFAEDYPAAMKHFQQAVNIHEKLKNRKELSYDYLKMGKIFRLTKQYDKALEYADKGSAIAVNLGLLDFQKDFSLLRSEIYSDQKQYKLAYENQVKHNLLQDSILRKNVYAGVADVKYKNVYKEKLNSSKTREDKLQKTVRSKDGELQLSQQQKAWWIAGSLCLLIVLGFVIALLKIRKVKMENKQLLTEQKLRRSQMNPHFIFNSIQNIRSLIHDGQEKQAVDYLNQFSKLTRQILESSNENYTSLADEIELIENYISIQRLLYDNAFEYKVNIDESIDAESIFLPPMLTQPFIENAIKHGLSDKKDNGLLNINFDRKGDKLFFEISDNGAGFNDVKEPGSHKSMAMDITRERLVNYTKNPDFVVHADNIFDRDRKIVGAKVAFEIPYIYEN